MENLLKEINDAKEAIKNIPYAKKNKYRDLQLSEYETLPLEDRELIIELSPYYRRVKKALKKYNTALKWQNKMNDAKNKLSKLHERVTNSTKLFAMDLEMYEQNGDITEVGVSIWENEELTNYHFVVAETYDLRNGRNVPDHKDNFLFGESELLPLKDIESKVYNLVQGTDYLVGHAFGNDKHFLTQSGYFGNTQVLDTQTYAPFYLLENDRHSLKRIVLGTLKEEPQCLHNGGNDAYYTMRSLLKMAGVL